MEHDWKENTCTKCKLFRFISSDSCERIGADSLPYQPKIENNTRYYYIPNSIDFSIKEQEGECAGEQESVYRLERVEPKFLNSETMWDHDQNNKEKS